MWDSSEPSPDGQGRSPKANGDHGRTVIAVAHRLSTIRKMDRIIVVKDGHIIEEGSHDLLVKIEHGLYQRLWNLQSTDLLPDATDVNGYIQ